MMTQTKAASVHVKISQDVKNQAEDILEELGISESTAIDLYYRQIISNNGIPFKLTLNDESTLTKEEFDRKINIGYEQAKKGDGIPAHQAFKKIMGEL